MTNKNSMVKSVFFLPHGMEVIPGTGDGKNEKFDYLNNKIRIITDSIAKENIETVYLLTPHGYNLDRSFSVYLHNSFQGFTYRLKDSVVFGDIKERLEIKGNVELAEKLKHEMITNDIPTEGLIHGSPDYPMTLNWGTTVPIYYLNKKISPQYVIICIPRIRHENIDFIRKDLEKLATLLSSRNENYAIVVSGDLSHVHSENGPYGYHKSCIPFDKLVIDWMNNPDDGRMEELLKLQPTALACGMAGLYFLQQLFKGTGNSQIGFRHTYYEVPTYFGMGIGKWRL